MLEKNRSISIVIPVYNSQTTITELIKRLSSVLPNICSQWEILLVDDGSRDKSWEEIRNVVSVNDRVKGIRLTRNYGQHNALLKGISEVNYDLIITMDDDLQHPPEELSKLVKKLEEGYDVVYGYPIKENHDIFRNLASRIIKKIIARLTGGTDKLSAFRIFRSHLRRAFTHYNSNIVSLDVLLTWGTRKIESIEVEHAERKVGKSNYSLLRLYSHAFNLLTGFSTIPLRFASYLGLIFTLFGLILLIYVILNYLVRGGSVPGFSFIASTLTLFSGIQLFTLGIFGEYIARIFVNTSQQPQSIIDEKIGFE